jgi:hypothetical protein
VPAAEVHILDAGHFALDEQPAAIADLTRGFLGPFNASDHLTLPAGSNINRRQERGEG